MKFAAIALALCAATPAFADFHPCGGPGEQGCPVLVQMPPPLPPEKATSTAEEIMKLRHVMGEMLNVQIEILKTLQQQQIAGRQP